MCPVWDSSNKRCKVSPSDSQCYLNESEQKSRGCLNERYQYDCANYDAYKRGDYKEER